MRDIYHIYELEANDFQVAAAQASDWWQTLLKVSGIFFTITIIVFFITNYPYIRSQLEDWEREKGSGNTDLIMSEQQNLYLWRNENEQGEVISYQLDSDKDGLSDSLELKIGTNVYQKDSDGDGYDDFLEFSRGYDPGGAGMIKAELVLKQTGCLIPLNWRKEKSKANGLWWDNFSAFPLLKGTTYLKAEAIKINSKKQEMTCLRRLLMAPFSDERQFSLKLSFANGKQMMVQYQKQAQFIADITQPDPKGGENEAFLVISAPLITAANGKEEPSQKIFVKAQIIKVTTRSIRFN